MKPGQSRASKPAQFSNAADKRTGTKAMPKVVAGIVFALLVFGGLRIFSGARGAAVRESVTSAIGGQSAFKELVASKAVRIPVADVSGQVLLI